MKHPLRRRWMFLTFRGVRAIVRWLPLSVAQTLGGWLGYAAYGLLGKTRAQTLAHLGTAFGPALSASPKHRIARRLFMNLGKNAMEWCVLERLSAQSIRRRVDIQGLAHLHRSLAKGRGVIALSAHFGNWELLALTLAACGFQGGVLARRLRDPEYESFLVRMRKRQGVATWERGSVKDVARRLQANQMIGMMPDQDIDSLEGVFVDFFDRPTYTPVGPAALTLMTGAPILPCVIIRTGRRFRIVIDEPIPITRTGDRTRDLIAITQAWSRVVESYIRCYPDHWVWMHRRWKTAPAQVETWHATATHHHNRAYESVSSS